MVVFISKYFTFSNYYSNSAITEGNRNCSAVARIRGKHKVPETSKGVFKNYAILQFRICFEANNVAQPKRKRTKLCKEEILNKTFRNIENMCVLEGQRVVIIQSVSRKRDYIQIHVNKGEIMLKISKGGRTEFGR
jgi:hypothetical protein